MTANASEKFDELLGLPDPPIIGVLAVIGYGLGANVCFTVDWVAEILVKKVWHERSGAFGQIHFVFGLLFSILLTLTPAALFTGLLFLRFLVFPAATVAQIAESTVIAVVETDGWTERYTAQRTRFAVSGENEGR